MEEKVKAENETRKSRADVMEELLKNELLPLFKKMAEVQTIENALKDARIAGDEKLVDSLTKTLVEKLNK